MPNTTQLDPQDPPKRDPLLHPAPGDRVKKGKQVRKVYANDNGHIVYRVEGTSEMPAMMFVKKWRDWAKGAEVLSVSPQDPNYNDYADDGVEQIISVVKLNTISGLEIMVDPTEVRSIRKFKVRPESETEMSELVLTNGIRYVVLGNAADLAADFGIEES
jgi:hypothetical protein